MKTLRELAAGLDGITVSGDPDTVVDDIQYDSRLVKPGDLFVAMRGGYADGHEFIGSALDRGAVALMSERRLQGSIPTMVATDTRLILPRIAARFFDSPAKSLRVVGITGTDGKTTTSYLLDSIFERSGFRTGAVGTVAVKIAGDVVQHETRQTTPESLDVQRLLAQMVAAKVDWAILEATSHGLALHRLDEIEFDIAAVTNITHEHLEFHGTVENYRAAKANLFSRLIATGGTSVINIDDEGARSVIPAAHGSRIVTFSAAGRAADVRAIAIDSGSNGSSFHLAIGGDSRLLRLPLLGRFNVENALLAAAIAWSAGVDLTMITDALESPPAVPGRMETITLGQPFTVVVDYAHTPESLSKLLSLFREINPDKKLICVSGSAGERDIGKRALQGAVSVRLADFSVFTTEDPRFEDPEAIIEQIAAGAIAEGAMCGRDFVSIVDRRAAIDRAMASAEPGDIVVLAGKGHERSIIWGSEKRPWDESGEARQSLQRLGFGGPT